VALVMSAAPDDDAPAPGGDQDDIVLTTAP
jgi:hypothetical protein